MPMLIWYVHIYTVVNSQHGLFWFIIYSTFPWLLIGALWGNTTYKT
uniref:Uncharacterized protein n=1 Tax=Arundo donax TaxID=35708 RepID=A0A0A9A371_ARUDO